METASVLKTKSMLKNIFIACLIILGSITASHAQTLRITNVNSEDDKVYNEVSAKALGKNLVLTIYDKSVQVDVPNEKPMFLREVSDNNYSAITSDTPNETWRADLSVNTTLGVVTSASLTITVSEKGGSYRRASCTITAKRF